MKVEKRLELKAPIERVWTAITDPAELSMWFPDRVELDLRPGGGGFLDWDEHGKHQLRVELAEPPTHLVWHWMTDAGTPFDEALATRVEWTLTPTAGGGTILELVETGFASLKSRQENDRGWDSELGELVAYLERVPVREVQS